MLAGLSPPDPGGAKLSWKRSPFQNLPFLLPISRARQPPKNHQLKQTFRNQRHVHISITDVLQLIVSICSSHLFTIVRDDLVLNEHWNIYIYIIYIACLPFSIQQQHEPVHHSDCLQVKEKKKRTKTTLIYNRRAYCRYQENTLTLVDFFLALLHFPLFFSLLVAFRRPHCKQTSQCIVERDSFSRGEKVKKSRWLCNHDAHSHAFASSTSECRNREARTACAQFSCRRLETTPRGAAAKQLPVIRIFVLLHNICRPISPRGLHASP